MLEIAGGDGDGDEDKDGDGGTDYCTIKDGGRGNVKCLENNQGGQIPHIVLEINIWRSCQSYSY